MIVADVAAALDAIAPPALAEDWDNVGLLVGDPAGPCERVLCCIDLTPAVLAEARRKQAQMVMAYHPVIFKGVDRVLAPAGPLYEAIRAGVAVYSCHTAYDNAVGGANDCLADALGMSQRRRPLRCRRAQSACKIVVFVPETDLERVSAAAFAAGAGRIGDYSRCGFSAAGTGTFFGEAGAAPAVGQAGRWEQAPELRWETVCPAGSVPAVIDAVRRAHSYETPAIDVIDLTEIDPAVGLGRIGELTEQTTLAKMIERVKKACGVDALLQVGQARGPARSLAVGCGSCGSLYRAAADADLYVTGELRHHDALAAAALGMTVLCVGHSNSERLTLKPLARRLRKLAPPVEVILSRCDRDPMRIR